MEDARTSTSSQRIERTFDTLLECPEADITTIPVVRSEAFPTRNSRNIPVSVQELVYGVKTAGVGTSSKPLDRDNAILSSSKDIIGPRKDTQPSEGLETHLLQRTMPKDKNLAEKPKNFGRGTEERVGPKKRTKAQWKLLKHPQARIFLKWFQTRERKPQRAIRGASKRKREIENPSGTSLTLRITEFQRGKR
ncbi:hypothetical protein O181_022518 [Austropuccinia psidii MF-1]|uniref:Uncharacterized protein n=1 Tax=Austropuccinia psidii MF-1 TaxID=1389203 RepID=A0A9Q3CH13_9BASI|nr:hypothetical protein [Austropuccinia psidii MF-1]